MPQRAGSHTREQPARQSPFDLDEAGARDFFKPWKAAAQNETNGFSLVGWWIKPAERLC
jgi:hypothetical protein